MSNYSVSWVRWDYKVKKDGSQKPSKVHISNLKEAEKLAKALCHNSWGWEVRIHWIDWKIKDSDTVKPWKDPFPPKDKIH